MLDITCLVYLYLTLQECIVSNEAAFLYLNALSLLSYMLLSSQWGLSAVKAILTKAHKGLELAQLNKNRKQCKRFKFTTSTCH